MTGTAVSLEKEKTSRTVKIDVCDFSSRKLLQSIFSIFQQKSMTCMTNPEPSKRLYVAAVVLCIGMRMPQEPWSYDDLRS
eukprot:scaffold2047_cov129-Cylindrotheca_fusiformis.AAC.43